MELDKFIWKFVDKYHMLPALHGVYMDPEEEAAVATDGHAMLVCHELYDKDKADMIVFKDGHCVKNGDFVTTSDGRKKEKIEYPKWQTALPHEWRNRYKIKENDKYHYGFVYNDVKIDDWFKEKSGYRSCIDRMGAMIDAYAELTNTFNLLIYRTPLTQRTSSRH